MTLLTTFTSIAQDITGKWHGVLKVQGTQLRLVFNVTKTDDGFSTTMDSPDQGAKNIPVTSTVFINPKIKFMVSNLAIVYDGEYKDGEITGVFVQGGLEFPMNLSREPIEKDIVNRPQEPKKPYPYNSEAVTFKNTKADITLSGTLTLPKNGTNFPVVILISGSGPQNRDEELLGHKPFLVISDYLTKHGIAVLRYDDRGVGQSSGDFKTATTADFATDVESAMAYLKTRQDINSHKIGLVGHSEGGLIAPMVASKSKDVNFMVLLAGPGISGYDIFLLQSELINKANGLDESALQQELAFLKTNLDVVVKGNDLDAIKSVLTDTLHKQLLSQPELLPKGMEAKDVDTFADTFTTPWFHYFLKYNPSVSLEQVQCPVLAINGEKDLQVPPKENLSAIEQALIRGGNKNISIKELPNLNHLFQDAITGSPNEYSTIEQTFSPDALEEITNWILLQTK
ncbi:alpha/beta hydrolase family protein [Formosa agariphila KMM 3901]|uniref:Alpha/beta hydrolase family protein n=2 Tax=Formosa TaxID=225842 RepID=T2KKR7_FORAG|nr:alpha/beta hydrolase family protein [Formosa agariphila KMM 3901]